MGVFWGEVRASGNDVFTRGGTFPLGLLEKGDNVANLVGSFLMQETTERPLLSRAKTRSSLAKDLGVLVLAFPHLKSNATSWSEKVFKGRPSPPGQGEGGMNTFG